MSDKNSTKTTTEKTPAIKKAAAKKKTVSVKKTAKKTVSQTSPADPSITSIIEEMNSQRQSRDRQISALIEEVRDGFSTLSSNVSKQDKEHQKEMTELYQSLRSAFSQIDDRSVEEKALNQDIFKSMSDSMVHEHQLTLKEINEQGKVQDKKTEYMTRMLEQRTNRNRLIAIPGIIIAIIAVIYMFYVVSVMETAMSDISANMHLMQTDVSNMSAIMGDMSQDTASINTNMEHLNGNMGMMSQDLNLLTHNVAPAMKGMRDVMPWSP